MVTAAETENVQPHEHEEQKKTTTDDGSSSDDEMPELEEGEVTEQQKKVAEAAGLSEQVIANEIMWSNHRPRQNFGGHFSKKLSFLKGFLGSWVKGCCPTLASPMDQIYIKKKKFPAVASLKKRHQ